MKDAEAEQGCPAVCPSPPVAPPAPQVWCTPSSLAQGPRCKGTGQETRRPGLRRARPRPRAVDAGWVTDAHSRSWLSSVQLGHSRLSHRVRERKLQALHARWHCEHFLYCVQLVPCEHLPIGAPRGQKPILIYVYLLGAEDMTDDSYSLKKGAI